MRRLIALAIVAMSAVADAPAASAQQGSGEIRGLLIGVDDYRHVPGPRGAVADALDMRTSLRAIGANDITLMVDEEAGRSSVLKAFTELADRSGKDDVVFLSVAGNGAREPERFKGSKPDGKDAVFLLSGFDPGHSAGASEKILDSEFNHVIRAIEAKGARVIFTLDASFGGDVAREVDPRAREMNYRMASYQPGADELTPISTAADAAPAPTGFTRSDILMASDMRSRAPEVLIAGAGFRGALSYAVARGLEGAADLNADGKVTAAELLEYAARVTYQISDQRQRIVAAAAPGFDANADVLFRPVKVASRGIAVEPTGPGALVKPAPAAPGPSAGLQVQPPVAGAPSSGKVAGEAIRVAALDRQADRFVGLSVQTPFDVVAPDANPDIVWDPASRDVLSGGDVVARNVARNDLPGVIERTFAVRWLKTRATLAPQPITITPAGKLHHAGAQVEIAVDGLSGRALLMFNIAGNGTVQMLYPTGGENAIPASSPYRIKVEVREPFGTDQIVAISAARRLTELERAINQLDNKRTPSKIPDLIERFASADVLIGSAGLFTAP